MRSVFLLAVFTIIFNCAFAQSQSGKPLSAKEDSTALATNTADSITNLKPLFMTPKKTGLFSAIVPGLGQFHNKHYWKIPVIYAGVGVAVYFVSDNLKNYNAFRKEYAGRLSQDPSFVKKFPEYKDAVVKSAQDTYRRNLDLTVLFTGLGYTLQVIDAVVFAHLKGFDMSEDISLNARPVMTPQGGMGFGLVMTFK